MAGSVTESRVPPTESTLDDVREAIASADAAGDVSARSSAADRSRLLTSVADRLDAARPELIEAAAADTRLASARLDGELSRTLWQLRMFAGDIERSSEAAEVDAADPSWPAGGRPELRRTLRSVGPVLVFEAGNFPFAYGVAGTDTASAWAAGCPVVLKVHPGHAAVSELTGTVAAQAIADCGWPPGMLRLVYGLSPGVAALRDPRIAAAAFTGSTRGGRALYDIACARPTPIPFYGELGSINPVFITERAIAARRDEILAGLLASYTGSAGQLCTKPGIVFVPAGAGFDVELARAATTVGAAELLSDEISAGYAAAASALLGTPGVQALLPPQSGRSQQPALAAVSAADFLANPQRLQAECFGPLTLLVQYDEATSLPQIAAALEGQLTATVHSEPGEPGIGELLWQLSRLAGRIVHNGWPTGVAVTAAQHHGGPYPAATSFHTSVGSAAIERFRRPVVFQNMPPDLVTELRLDAETSGQPT